MGEMAQGSLTAGLPPLAAQLQPVGIPWPAPTQPPNAKKRRRFHPQVGGWMDGRMDGQMGGLGVSITTPGFTRANVLLHQKQGH